MAPRGIKHHSRRMSPRAQTLRRNRGHEMPAVLAVGHFLACISVQGPGHRPHDRGRSHCDYLRARLRRGSGAIVRGSGAIVGAGLCTANTVAEYRRPRFTSTVVAETAAAIAPRSGAPTGQAASVRELGVGAGLCTATTAGIEFPSPRPIGSLSATHRRNRAAQRRSHRRPSNSRGPYCLHPASCRKIADGPMMLRD